MDTLARHIAGLKLVIGTNSQGQESRSLFVGTPITSAPYVLFSMGLRRTR